MQDSISCMQIRLHAPTATVKKKTRGKRREEENRRCDNKRKRSVDTTQRNHEKEYRGDDQRNGTGEGCETPKVSQHSDTY